jgi:uncharacterized protein (DUF302 family)
MEKKFAIARTLLCLLAAGFLAAESSYAADAPLKPYVLAEEFDGPWAEKFDAVKNALAAAGFEIAGEYQVQEGAAVLVVTGETLKTVAAATDLGGYGAAVRVSVTSVDGKVQVAYTNPVWMANVYRMGGDLAEVAAALGAALGSGAPFGSKDGQTAAHLRSYHYMVMMPYFTDQEVLAKHASHAEALEKVESGLTLSKEVRRISRIDIPGKDQSLFSVAILAGSGSDATVLKATDTAHLRHTAYLPYEFLVSGGKVMMLHGKFRIAQSFPDLTMGTFMKISGAPAAIEKAIKSAVR